MIFSERKIDRIIKKNGTKPEVIYYSSPKEWFIWLLLIGVSLPGLWYLIVNFLLEGFGLKGFAIIFIYFSIAYEILTYINKSIAISKNEFWIIRSHFLFPKIEKIPLRNIKKVDIITNQYYWPFLFIGIFHTPFIKVSTINNKKKYYCLFLGIEDYGQISTDK